MMAGQLFSFPGMTVLLAPPRITPYALRMLSFMSWPVSMRLVMSSCILGRKHFPKCWLYYLFSRSCPCHPEPLILGNYRYDDVEVVEGGMQDYNYLFSKYLRK